MNYKNLKPNKALEPYIDRYWFFTNSQSETYFRSQINPGAGCDLFIHLTTPFSSLNGTIFPQSHLAFSGTYSTQIVSDTFVDFIAVRFKAGALKNFTNIPLTYLQDISATPENIWSNAGADLTKKVNATNDKNEIVRHIENFLVYQLEKFGKTNFGWTGIIQKFYKHFDAFTVDDLSKELNSSNRNLRRKFISEIGFSPKHFQKLGRFHYTIKPLILNKNIHYLSQALDSGYFDQNHFIKDFKQFMNCTPSQFLKSLNEMSHFYYPSIGSGSNFASKN